MPPDIRHNFISPVPDNGDPALVQGPDWNEAHAIQQGPASLLGRADSTPGATQEVALDASLTFVGGKLATSSAKVGLSFTVDHASARTVRLPDPALPVTGMFAGLFVVDGETVVNGATVHLLAQTDPRQNGIYSYEASPINRLTRIPSMATGMTITRPVYVNVNGGDEFFGATFSLVEESFKVGSETNTWAEEETGAGSQPSNTAILGTNVLHTRPRLARVRTLRQEHLGQYRVRRSATSGIDQSVYLNLNRWGYVSRYVSPVNVWDNDAALRFAMQDNNTVVFDTMVYLKVEISKALYPLDNRTMIFEGTGWDGPCRVVLTAQNMDFLNLNGVRNLTLKGRCIVEGMVPRRTNAVRAVKASTPFSNFKCDELWTRDFSESVIITTTHGGYDIGRINRYVGHVPFSPEFALSASAVAAPSSDAAWVGRIDNIPTYQTFSDDAVHTLIPHRDSPYLTLSGVYTTNRTITLSTINVTKTAQFDIRKTGVDAFNASIVSGTTGSPVLTTLTTGQACTVGWDGVAGLWRLNRKYA